VNRPAHLKSASPNTRVGPYITEKQNIIKALLFVQFDYWYISKDSRVSKPPL